MKERFFLFLLLRRFCGRLGPRPRSPLPRTLHPTAAPRGAGRSERRGGGTKAECGGGQPRWGSNPPSFCSVFSPPPLPPFGRTAVSFAPRAEGVCARWERSGAAAALEGQRGRRRWAKDTASGKRKEQVTLFYPLSLLSLFSLSRSLPPLSPLSFCSVLPPSRRTLYRSALAGGCAGAGAAKAAQRERALGEKVASPALCVVTFCLSRCVCLCVDAFLPFPCAPASPCPPPLSPVRPATSTCLPACLCPSRLVPLIASRPCLSGPALSESAERPQPPSSPRHSKASPRKPLSRSRRRGGANIGHDGAGRRASSLPCLAPAFLAPACAAEAQGPAACPPHPVPCLCLVQIRWRRCRATSCPASWRTYVLAQRPAQCAPPPPPLPLVAPFCTHAPVLMSPPPRRNSVSESLRGSTAGTTPPCGPCTTGGAGSPAK